MGKQFAVWRMLDNLKGVPLVVAQAVAGIAILLIVLIPFGWWADAASPVRSVLEALPTGDAVAERPSEHGNPALVGLLGAIGVGAAVYGATRWRRSAARRFLYGGLTFVQLYAISVLRTLLIFGGISLVPNLAFIAYGTDLREEPSQTFTGPVVVLAVLAAWALYSYYGLGKVVDREATRPPSLADRPRRDVAAAGS